MCFHFPIIAFSLGIVNCTGYLIYQINSSAIVIGDEYKEKQRKGAVVAKRIYNISLGICILAVGLLVVFLDKISNDTLHEYLDFNDPLLQNLFGGLCIIYGLFRFYRGIKKDYQ